MGKRSGKKHQPTTIQQFVRQKRAVENKHVFALGHRVPICQRITGQIGPVGDDGFCKICDSVNNTLHWDVFREFIDAEEAQISNR